MINREKEYRITHIAENHYAAEVSHQALPCSNAVWQEEYMKYPAGQLKANVQFLYMLSRTTTSSNDAETQQKQV